MAIPFYEMNEDHVDGEWPHQPDPHPHQHPPAFPMVTNDAMITFVSIGMPPLSLQLVHPSNEPPYSMWDFDEDEVNPTLLTLCKNLAESMANVVKEYYEQAVATGHPITSAVVHIAPNGASPHQ